MNTFRIGDLILINNHKFILCDKPCGIGVQDDKIGDKSLHALAEIYCKTTLYPVNRIDRPVSGLVVMAKDPETATLLNDMLTDGRIEKTYLAVTKNKPELDTQVLEHFLVHDKRTNKSFILEEENQYSKIAKLEYTIIGKSDNYYYWKIKLLTGRHHQIRVQLAAIGCPVKGDVKYGDRRSNKDKSIHLISWKIKFNELVHPKAKELEATIPDEPLWNFMKENIKY